MASKIGGENRVVAIDESLLVRRKYSRGRLLKQQTEEILLPIILRRIEVGNKIISDGWGSYLNLSTLGFYHEVIIHDDYFVDPNDSEVLTQNVEGMWSVLKRFLRKHGTRQSPHEFEYVAEFFFRWGRED
ncbi:hypothetical protein HZS_7889, partial [Henneguya salminicola]